jgi:Tfp pilus assembly protein PilN
MKKSSRTLLTLLVGTVVVLALLALVQSYTKTEGFQSSKPWTRADKIDDLLSSTKSEIAALNAEIQKAEAERQGKMNSLKAAIDAAVKE